MSRRERRRRANRRRFVLLVVALAAVAGVVTWVALSGGDEGPTSGLQLKVHVNKRTNRCAVDIITPNKPTRRKAVPCAVATAHPPKLVPYLLAHGLRLPGRAPSTSTTGTVTP